MVGNAAETVHGLVDQLLQRFKRERFCFLITTLFIKNAWSFVLWKFSKKDQKELHKVAQHWNTHRKRPSTNPKSPSGRPDVLYFLPQTTGTRDYATPVTLDDIEMAEDESSA